MLFVLSLAITIYCFLTKKNKVKSFVSVCSKQTEVFRFRSAHPENGSFSFVRLLTKKQTEVINLQTD
jgi:hypothetical protein